MKKSNALAIIYFAILSITCMAQNKTYNFEDEGIYYPNLNEEWVIVSNDTATGYWIQDTFFNDDNIHSYVFRDSGIETRWNVCEPPTDVVFKTQLGIPYQAEYWSFRKNTKGIYLLGYADINTPPFISILLTNVRYNPTTGRIVGYQNGIKTIVRNPIDRTAFE